MSEPDDYELDQLSGSSSGSPTYVDAKQYVAPGTGFQAGIGYFAFPFIVLISVAASYGIALIFWLIAAVTRSATEKKNEALLRGSSLKIDDDQFPGIYERASRIAEQLGMSEAPDVYVYESNEQNAMAMKIGAKHTVLLIDDIVYGALATKNPKVLDFFIAHELAHHVLGHTKMLRGVIRQANKRLSRLDEFSCDAVAAAVVNDKKTSYDAMALLISGPQLFKSVNTKSVVDQAMECAENKYSLKAERSLTHPLPLRRLARLIDPSVKP